MISSVGICISTFAFFVNYSFNQLFAISEPTFLKALIKIIVTKLQDLGNNEQSRQQLILIVI